MKTNVPWSAKVAARFNRAASTYDQHARLQQQVATHLLALIRDQLMTLPVPAMPQHWVDLGCGTGDIALGLQRMQPDAALTLIDIAPAMLAISRARLQAQASTSSSPPTIQTIAGDAAQVQLAAPADWVVSSLCLQWVEDLPNVLHHWLGQTTWLALTLPLRDSLSSWRAAHAAVEVPLGWRDMPDLPALQQTLAEVQAQAVLHSMQIDICHVSQHTHTVPYPHALAFARHLKAIGADTAEPTHRPGQLRRVLRWLAQQADTTGTTATTEFIADYQIAYVLLHVRQRSHPVKGVA